MVSSFGDHESGVRQEIPSGGGRAYWRAIDEMVDTPEFQRLVEKEFPSIAAQVRTGSSRRTFLKLMGASLALAGAGGLSGCIRWPKENILPFAARPEGRYPGRPVQYATAMELGGVAQPLLVTSYDGRPVKIEGNDQHSQSGGSSTALQQASVLGLYDPMRSMFPRHDVPGHEGQAATWEQFRTAFESLRGGRGGGLHVLAPPSSSVALVELRKKALPAANWTEWDPLSRDHEREGARLAFGKPLRTHYRLDRAEIIAAFDSDFLMTHPDSLRMARDFAAGRRGKPAMNRLYVVESFHSVTGAAGDERMPVRAQDVGAILARVAHLLEQRGIPLPPAVADLRGSLADARVPETAEKGIQNLVADLATHRDSAVVIVGERQPAAVHALAHAINAALGSVGNNRPVRYTQEPDGRGSGTHRGSIQKLVRAMNEGEVTTLLILDGNPVYDAPEGFAAALKRVPNRIHLSLYRDETSAVCNWHVPAAHYLESWGDARSWDGRVCIVQPLIAPLYGGKNALEVLSLLLEAEPRGGHEIVREAVAGRYAGGDPEKTWRESLEVGFLKGSELAAVPRPALEGGWSEALDRVLSGAATDTLEVVFIQDYSVYDGRFVNNGWLQEMPDPVTKLVWDNAAIIGVDKSRQLGVEQGDMLKVTVGNRSMELPVYILPGHSNQSVTIPLGYGREIHSPRDGADEYPKIAGGGSYNRDRYPGLGYDGSLRNEDLGFNTYRVRPVAALARAGVDVEITRTGRHYELVTTQKHHTINDSGALFSYWERGNFTHMRVGELVRSQHIDDYKKHPDRASDRGHKLDEHGKPVHHYGYTHQPEHIESLWDDKVYQGARWAMAIDLSTCTGCSACVVACQAENNIGVTGKREVANGREMHWIRVDRYFTGLDENQPRVVHQPVTCQHCENAPCEQVCPVAATTHSEEGLNDMVYNRCIGTRYCANNCPYKVRRFNYFNNFRDVETELDHEGAIESMVLNPEVTVRHRGVMEKCTFCVQRINSVKISARNAGRSIRDGEITPACAQACPTQAITFGDLSDANSRVSGLHRLAEGDRGYKLLEELNTRPRNVFLAKLVNSVEEMDLRPHNPAERKH